MGSAARRPCGDSKMPNRRLLGKLSVHDEPDAAGLAARGASR
jgi:hypothetical protein